MEKAAAMEHLASINAQEKVLLAFRKLKMNSADGADAFVEVLQDRLLDHSQNIIQAIDTDVTNILKGRCREATEMLEMIYDTDNILAGLAVERKEANQVLEEIYEASAPTEM